MLDGWMNACMMDAECVLCDIMVMSQGRREHEARETVGGRDAIKSLVLQFLFPVFFHFFIYLPIFHDSVSAVLSML